MINPTLRLKGRPDGLDNINKAVERSQQKMLENVGKQIEQIAKDSMPHGMPGQVSLPDTPPFSHTEQYKQGVHSAWDKESQSVVVGATVQNWRGGVPVPEIIECGGLQIITNQKTGQDRVGQYQPRPALRLALQTAIDNGAIEGEIKDFVKP